MTQITAPFPPAGRQPEDLVRPFTVGSLQCKSLSDGFIVVPVPLLAAEVPIDEIKALLRENGLEIELHLNPISCLYVVLPDGRKLVVDAGLGESVGPDGAPIRTAGRLPDALAQAGIDPADIDLVLVSHVHPDHIGGLFDAAGEPRFANAEYLVSRQEVEFWQSPQTDLGGTLMPPPMRVRTIATARRFLEQAAGRLRVFEGGEPALEGVDTQLLPGHTAGQVGFIFDGGDAKLFYTADAGGHAVISLQHPEWRFAFDADAPLAIDTRKKLVAQLVETDVQTFTPHFPWPSFGHVEARDGKPVWVRGGQAN